MVAAPLSTKPKPFVFVLMPFDQKFADIYTFGIKGAAEDAGAFAQRVDEQIFVEGMLDRIFNQINKADVIVADMTAKNPNVFYEVGYAHALDKVVLLITQSADDIPFDLKHRQHIVYGGSIDTLRRELASRITWAIEEATRRGSYTGTERMSVRLLGIELRSGLGIFPVPELRGQVTAASFHLPLHVRNDSERGLLEISHVYLFAPEDAHMRPSSYAAVSNAGVGWSPQFGNLGSSLMDTSIRIGPSFEFESFPADPVDAPDGLTRQFRIPTRFGVMPPRATEGMELAFELRGKKCDEPYRLRFHTASSYFDFPFRFVLSRIEAASSTA